MDPQHVIDNRTPMAVTCIPMDDRHGREVAVVIMKMAYDVSPAGVIRAVLFGAPIRASDVPAGEGPWASIRYPSDLVDDKPGTDVIVVGTAHPPPGVSVTEQDVSVCVETGQRALKKTVRVYGARIWYGGAFGLAPGPAAPLGPTPIAYELAFGGVEERANGETIIDWRNPAGTGVSKDRNRLLGAPAPAIEDPDRPLARSAPAPAGFGPIPAHWSPRRERAGTHDDRWRRERAPIRPVDFDPRHHSCAVPELWSEARLAGDEPVEILGMRPEGALRFQLPRYAPILEIEGARGGAPQPALDTFHIDADSGRVELTFRASLPLPRKSERLGKIRVRASADLPQHIGITS